MDQLVLRAVIEDLYNIVRADRPRAEGNRSAMLDSERQMLDFLRDLRSGKLTVVETEEFFS